MLHEHHKKHKTRSHGVRKADMDRTVPTYLKNKFVLLLIGVIVLTAGILGFTYWNAANNVQPAANRTEADVYNQDRGTTSVADWTASANYDVGAFGIMTKASNQLVIGYKAGPKYATGQEACWNLVIPRPANATQYRVNYVDFDYLTNEAGANGVKVKVNGQSQNVTIIGGPGGHQGGAQFNRVIRVATPGLVNGGTVSICNYVLGNNQGNGTHLFTDQKTIYVSKYNIFGEKDIPDAPAAPTTVKVTGQVRDWNNKNLANVTIDTCIAGVSPKTNSQGIYEFSVPHSTSFCLRVNTGGGGIPAGTTGVKANAGQAAGSIAAAGQGSYEYQVAGVACRNGGCAPVQGTNDRDVDTGYTFSLLGTSPTAPAPSTPTTLKCAGGSGQKVTVINAEAGVCGNGTVPFTSPADQVGSGTSVILPNTNSTVEYTFSAPADGKYVAAATMSNDNRYKSTAAKYRLSIATAGGAQSSSSEALTRKGTSATAASYSDYGLDAAKAVNATNGQSLLVRVTFLEAQNSTTNGDQNLYVDQLKLVKVGELPATPGAGSGGSSGNTGNANGTCTTPHTAVAPAGATRIEAESVGSGNRSASAVAGPIHVIANTAALNGATGCQAVRLVTDAGFVKYQFSPAAGSYSLVVRGKGSMKMTSVNRSGVTLNRNFGTAFTDQNVSSIVESATAETISVSANEKVQIEIKRNGGDAYVDFIELRKVADPPATNNGGNTGNAGGSAFSPCTNTGSGRTDLVQAEQALCVSGGGVVADTNADGDKAVVLSPSGAAVEYKLRASTTGRYNAVAKMRSQLNNNGKVTFEVISESGAVLARQTGKAITQNATTYTRYTVSNNDKVVDFNLTDNQPVTIRIKSESSQLVRVDSFSLSREGNTTPSAGSGTSGTASNTVACAKGASQQVFTVEAENATCDNPPKAAVFSGPANQVDGAFGGQAVILAANNSSVEYTFIAPEDNDYIAGARVSNDNRFVGTERAKFVLSIDSGGALRQSPEQTADGAAAGSKASNYKDRRATNQVMPGIKKGAAVRVKIVFTNNNGESAEGKDRNLFVDRLMLIPTKGAAANNPPTSGSTAPVACSGAGSGRSDYVEGEQAQCSSGVIVSDDAKAAGQKAALLRAQNNSLTYTFKVTEPGLYRSAASMRSQPGTTGKVEMQFSKLTPGQSPSIKTQANKAVGGSASYSRYTVRSGDGLATDPPHEFSANAGDELTISVKSSTNVDVLVDYLYLSKAPVSVVNCSNDAPNAAVVEAERSLCTGRVGVVSSANAFNTGAFGDKSVFLFTDNSSVQYTFTVSEPGKYAAVARASNDNRFVAGAGETAKFDLRIGKVGGIAKAASFTTKARATSTPTWDKFTLGEANRLCLQAGDKVTVRASFTNDNSGSTETSDRNLIVDQLELLKTGAATNCNTPPTTGGSSTDTPPANNPNGPEATSARYVRAENANAGCGRLTQQTTSSEILSPFDCRSRLQSDNQAENKKALSVTANKSFVTHEFNQVKIDGVYAVGFMLKAEKPVWPGAKAPKATLYINNSKVNTFDVATDKYRFYNTRIEVQTNDKPKVRIVMEDQNSVLNTEKLWIDSIRLIRTANVPPEEPVVVTPANQTGGIPAPQYTPCSSNCGENTPEISADRQQQVCAPGQKRVTPRVPAFPGQYICVTPIQVQPPTYVNPHSITYGSCPSGYLIDLSNSSKCYRYFCFTGTLSADGRRCVGIGLVSSTTDAIRDTKDRAVQSVNCPSGYSAEGLRCKSKSSQIFNTPGLSG